MKKPKQQPANIVTDHAVVRYIERILGFDVELIRKEIASGHEKAIAKLRRGNIKVHSKNMGLLIRDGFIVTVTEIKK